MDKMNEKRNGKLFLEKELLLPYTYLMKVGNKQLRKKIPLAFNEWFKLPDNVANKIVDLVDMLHNGSLLMDDIQDNTLIRRGVPAAHCVFGVPLTLNTSVHVVTLVLQKLLLGTSLALEEWPTDDDKKPQIFCEDLSEGKFSLPIIHAAGTSDGDGVLHILRQRTRDIALKKFCVSELQRLGSLEYTRNRLLSLDKYIRDEIKRLGGNSELTSVMDDMKSWE